MASEPTNPQGRTLRADFSRVLKEQAELRITQLRNPRQTKTANRQFAKSCALHAQQDPRFLKWATGHRPNRNSVFHHKTLAVWWAYSGHWPNHKTGTLSSIGHQPLKCIAQNQDPCFYSGHTTAIGQPRPLPFGGHSTNFTSHFGNKPDRNLVFHSGH